MIKYIIFDLGNVLVHIHPDQAMKEFADRCHLPYEEIKSFFLSENHLAFMEGRYTAEEFIRFVLGKYRCDLSHDEFVQIWNRVIGHPKNGIHHLIQQLSPQYHLSICSNTDILHWTYVKQKNEIIATFKKYFLSFELKMIKPELNIFNYILQNLNASGNECLFIDDISENLLAAAKLEIQGIQASTTEQIRDSLGAYGITVE